MTTKELLPISQNYRGSILIFCRYSLYIFSTIAATTKYETHKIFFILHSNQKLNTKSLREVEQTMGLHLGFLLVCKPEVCKWILFSITYFLVWKYTSGLCHIDWQLECSAEIMP